MLLLATVGFWHISFALLVAYSQWSFSDRCVCLCRCVLSNFFQISTPGSSLIKTLHT